MSQLGLNCNEERRNINPGNFAYVQIYFCVCWSCICKCVFNVTFFVTFLLLQSKVKWTCSGPCKVFSLLSRSVRGYSGTAFCRHLYPHQKQFCLTRMDGAVSNKREATPDSDSSLPVSTLVHFFVVQFSPVS